MNTKQNTKDNTGQIPPPDLGNKGRSKSRLRAATNTFINQPNTTNSGQSNPRVRTGIQGIDRTNTVINSRHRHFIDLNYVDEDRYWESLWFTIYGTDPRDIISVEDNEYNSMRKLTKDMFDYITNSQYCLVPSDINIDDLNSRLNRILQGFHQEQLSEKTAINTQHLINKLKKNVASKDGSTFFDLLIGYLKAYTGKCFECSITRDSMCTQECYSNSVKKGLTSCYDYFLTKSPTSEKGGRRTRRSKRSRKSKKGKRSRRHFVR
jgi:hypothetical protein